MAMSFSRRCHFIVPPPRVTRFEVSDWFVEVPRGLLAQPFVEGELSGVYRAPDGDEVAVRGFCDSADGTLFRVRFTPRTAGRYTYRLVFTGADVQEAYEGTFECVPGGRRGFVRIDPDHPQHFICEDGFRPYILSKTAWLLAVSHNALQFIDQAAANGFNCLRLAIETNYYVEEVGRDIWPWGGTRAQPDFERFNIPLWRRLEEIAYHAALRGVFLEPVLFCTMRREPKPPIPDEIMERYWDYLLARLSAFPNIIAWELFNEYDGNEDYQAYMAGYLRAHDPYRHLICTSWGTTEDAAWPDAEWLDLAINHSCTSSDPRRHGLDHYYRRVALRVASYGKPAWCDESGRERRHGNDDPVHRRKQAWVWAMSGVYWNYHSWGGCEGISSLMLGPGEEFMRHVRAFWEQRTQWWRMKPILDGVLSHPPCDYAYLLASDREAVAYLVNEESGRPTPAGLVRLRLTPGRYDVRTYDPATGRYTRVDAIQNTEASGELALETPSFVDDLVLHLVARDAR